MDGSQTIKHLLNQQSPTKNVSLKLTNTLTRRKEPFQPINQGKVTIYCCGVTVYDLCHLGHARSYLIWDVLRRHLIWQGYEVTFVQNFTDIDDKIINRAAEEGSSMDEVSERNILAFFEDMDSLGILRADRMPRATQCLDSIRSLIDELEANGSAYSVDGDVYFAVMRHKDYGKLSNRDLKEQLLNADGRISSVDGEKKKHAFDFALWKGAKEGEPSFPSPWGQGRPGWHIECSAMVREELGETIDIHLGGADLIFPHHENEIAQSEAATGQELARYWLHNGMVNVGGQKMSKSLGNFTTIRALLEQGISPMTLRFFVLQAHYRKPLDFTSEALESAAKGWNRLNEALCLGITHSQALGWPKEKNPKREGIRSSDNSLNEICSEINQRFLDLMNDDLNTSGALAILFELARPLRALSVQLKNNSTQTGSIHSSNMLMLHDKWKLLIELASVLGLNAEKSISRAKAARSNLDIEEINKAIEARKNAKSNKDFATADSIRNQLQSQGIKLIDKPGGETDWTLT